MLFQLIVGGTATGAIYALMAMGFALLWQTSQTINFAQGEFVTASAFIMLMFFNTLKVPYFVALVLTVVVAVGILGVLFKTVIVQRLIEKGLLSLICATIAVGILIQNSLIFYSAESQPFPSIVSKEAFLLFTVRLSPLDLLNIILAALAITALQVFIRRTKIGKALQAVAQNREVAGILGIDVPKMTTLAFAINAVIVTLAAILISPVYAAKYNMGLALGLRAFYAAIVGGFNQMRGALLGGLLIGYIEVFTRAYITSEYSEVVILVIVITIILCKPEGLWGTKEIWSKEL
jgi:branched-chain amino acid transport system permease protein